MAPSHLRVVSLLPSATEIVCVLGADSELVGISHECDYPPNLFSDFAEKHTEYLRCLR